MPETLTLPVDGMTCGGCENAVKRALGTMPGVAVVEASHRERRVVVTFDDAATSGADIERKIEQIGYRVVR